MSNAFRYKHEPVVRKTFLSMLVPTIFLNLTTAIGSIADSMIIGHYLDSQALSVVTFAMPIFMLINLLSALFAVGGCITVSIDSGKGEKDRANMAFSIALELMVVFGGLLLLAGLFLSGPIAGWLGAGEDVLELVRVYCRIILIGAPVFVLKTGLAFFVRNDGRPTLSMIGMFASILVDLTLNLIFVGSMDMGVAGAALSTVLGSLVSILIILPHFFTKKNTLRFRFTVNGTILRVLRNGLSSALTFVYQFLTILIMNHLLVRLAGTNGVVIYTVVFNLATVALSVFEGISQTIQPMVSTYFGERSFRNIRQTLRNAMFAIGFICLPLTAALELFPQVVPMLFGIDDAAIIANATAAVRIYAASMTLITLNAVIGYYLQSTEQSLLAAILVSLRTFVILLTATLLLGWFFGMNGVWAAYAVTEGICTCICVLALKAKQTKLKKQGQATDLLLLERPVTGSIQSYTFLSRKDNFREFKNLVLQAVEAQAAGTLSRTDAYLDALALCLPKKRSGFIQVEIIGIDRKVIIRDNLDHSLGQTALEPFTDDAGYAPALGANRLCMR